MEYHEALDRAHTTRDYTDFVKLIIRLEIEIFRIIITRILNESKQTRKTNRILKVVHYDDKLENTIVKK